MRRFIALMPACVVCLVGCSGSGFPETYPVTGVVTHDGVPVEGATVVLVHRTAEGRSASGSTDAAGKFEVTTYFSPTHQSVGALPGDYAITVNKKETYQTTEGLKPEEEMALFTKFGPPKDLLPKQYANPATSGLTVTVANGPTEPLTLELKGK